MKPYKEKILSENRVIRTFKNNVEEGELTWHRDREDRLIFALNENDWLFQEDNCLPIPIKVNEPIIIESGVYHRIIKGFGDLDLDIFKVNLDDEENIKTNINEIFMLFLEKSEKTKKGKKVPKRYLKGLKSKGKYGSKTAMKKEIDKFSGKDEYKKDWDADYTDKTKSKRIETKKSDATKAYEKMFKESDDVLENIDKTIENKSKETGVSKGILRQVYNRGKAAWNTGHSPGASQDQWAIGRINSFVTGEGGARKADADLWEKAKEQIKRKKESDKKKKN